MRFKLIFLLSIIFITSSVFGAGTSSTTQTKVIIPDGGSTPAPYLTASFAETISTDTSDYAPGDSVIIAGGGFWAGESVSIDITNMYNPGFGDNDEPWIVIADASGNIETYWIVPDDGVDQTYLLTADGLSSGVHAEVVFEDSNTKLTFTVDPEDVCPGAQITVCAQLKEICGHHSYAPLENRPIIFFLNPGNCGNNNANNGDDTVYTDANGIACATLTAPSTPGSYSITVKFEGESKPSWGNPGNSACDPSKRIQLSAANKCEGFEVENSGGNAPTVTINDSTVAFCDTGLICLPVIISDADCDIDSVSSNLGQYSGSISGYDQIERLNQLGGTVTQIGGGSPGLVLSQASDFVAPINTQSGVSVTLPNFIFADHVVNYGTFPNGIEPGNSADHLLYSPTDLTFTTPGAGGPDGGSGDGSVAFGNGNYCTIGFASSVTTCDGASVDFIAFTNSNGGGTAEIQFLNSGSLVHSLNKVLPGGTAASGFGGVNFDLPDGITFNQVKIKCISGTLEVDAVAARTAFSSTTTDICFTADTAGVYTVILSAYDGCGNVGADTAYVTVSTGTEPVANAGNDFSQELCALSEICFGVGFSDVDNDIDYTELVSPVGSLVGNQICFTPPSAGNYSFIIHVVDLCGLQDYDTVIVTVALNQAPVAVQPDSISQFLCTPIELCNQLSASDADGDSLVWSFLAGAGSVTPTGNFCFTPTASGTYSAVIAVADPCGNADTISVYYNITLNTKPVAVDPPTPVNKFLCSSEQICYQFSASDIEGGQLNWTMLAGSDGTITTNGLWCFTPSASGSYSINAVVTDSCGLADTTTKTYDVIINDAPLMTLGADTTYSICLSNEICIDYTVSDNQGLSGLTESMLSGFGTLDTLSNQICFTPPSAGAYQFVMSVTDSCGASDVDTINVTVEVGASVAITCPASVINVNLCDADSVCQMITVSPMSATVTSSLGTYAGGKLCFFADTSGLYTATLIADESCGSDTCEVSFNVVIGTAAQISCPAPENFFICDSDSICIPIGVNGSGVSVTVSPIGSYQSGNICFVADTSGHYEITVIAVTACGADTCVVTSDVVINSNPIATTPPASIDTFLCANQSVCYQFTASDADGGPLTWSKLSGIGTVSTSGEFCFNSSGAGAYAVSAVVTDSCGASDTVSMTFNVSLNTAPSLTLANDTTIFLCVSQSVCVPYLVSDINNNISAIELTAGNGVVDTTNSNICFYPLVDSTYQFIAKVTDDCGATDYDTVNVTVEFNVAPSVNAGADVNLSLCGPEEFCQTITSSDADGNLSLVEMTEGVGTFSGGQLCFTPDSNYCYEFIFRAVDDCGLEDFDTLIVCVDLNNAPIANAGADQTEFQCTPTQICLPASCSDVDGNLATCALVSSVGTYNGSDICFTPDTSGIYTFIIEATDACGLTDQDTVLVNVTLNSAPVCNIPSDTVISQCVLTPVCLPVSGSDVDGNLNFCQIISGPGTLSGGNWCYTPTASQVVNVTVECIDSCNVSCQSSFTVEFKINQAPTVTLETPAPFSFCEASQICVGYSVDDPNAPQALTITNLSGFGTLDTANNNVCFIPDSSGTYIIIVQATDDCGASAVDTTIVNVTLNSAPIVTLEADKTVNLCQSEQVCVNASVTDIDNNLVGVNLTGSGVYDGSTICFTPATSGNYQFILEGTDDCGVVAVDTININVVINNAPLVQFDTVNDTLLCTPIQLCLGYAVSDPDGLTGVTESMTSGFGTIDTANNQICFTPTTAGLYEFIVEVSDTCGAVSADTVSMQVDFGASASISCPSGTINVNLCAADEVCQMIGITPSTATVSTSFGTYSAGQLCFNADTSGLYAITIIADETCGSDTCEVLFNVTIGSGATISCPSAQSMFICQPDSICIPVGINGSGLSVSVSPIGSYQSGNICFPADTSGHYEINVVATATCGADSCVVVVDVVVNSNPIAVDPSSPIDTFLCTTGEICYQFDASDVDGGSLVWSRLSGNGTVTPNGLWCFNASANNSYSVTAVVTDSCGASDTLTLTYNVSVNVAPIITWVVPPSAPSASADVTVQLCSGMELCYNYTASDGNNNIVSETLLSGFGTIDTVNNNVCCTPDTTGSYVLMIQTTDGCSLTDVDTLVVDVVFNNAPIANAGADISIFACETSEICWGVSCSDVDNNLDSCYVTSSVGTYSSSTICFTPDTAGVYTFVLRAVDACGLSDEDTVNVTVSTNTAPICMMPNDTTLFQCSPTEIRLPINSSDVDNNFDHCEILAGPGSIIGNEWVYTPTSDQSVLVKIMCLDSCGASCIDSFTVSLEVNDPPVVDAGDDFVQFLCDVEQICFPITFSDPNNNFDSVLLVSPTGSYNSSTQEVCFTPTAIDGSKYTFVLQAVDLCGATDYDTVVVTVDYNEPPVLNLPSNYIVYQDAIGEVCFNANSSDLDGNLASVTVSSPGTYNQSTDEVCFTADSSGEYCFVVTATDDCGQMAVQNICINVQIDECFLLQIDKTHQTIQGQYETVKIHYDGSVKEIGGFDLTLGYDQTALTVGTVRPGELFTDCGWEYFTFRYGPNGNCQTGCPSGVLSIIGFAETNNGGYHPDCFLNSAVGDLVEIDFYVSNDRTLECQYAPIEFYWFDCGDNTLSSKLGDTLWVSRDVFSFEGNLLTDNSYGFPGPFGADENCMVGGGAPGKQPIRCVDFTNGGVDIVCADSIDAAGDINLNEIAYEIADAVLYSNYFVYGVTVFTVNVDGQIAASDVNKDGLTLSVADLVYLIRVIVGDAQPFAKLSPKESVEAQFAIRNGELIITETEDAIGAVSLSIKGDATPKLIGEARSMEMNYNFDGEYTNVLIYSLSGKQSLSVGKVLDLQGSTNISELEIGSNSGYVMNAKLETLPTNFELMQNYPNPFNPTTHMRFALPVDSDWELEIYNVLGQTVESFKDNSEAGYIEIEWDASKYASGVYFYRLRAGDFSDTKKMVLLK